jgi:SanA protein
MKKVKRNILLGTVVMAVACLVLMLICNKLVVDNAKGKVFSDINSVKYNKVVNANKIFGLKSFTIISQEFHNERALYQAEHLGLDLENIQAFNAEMPKSRRAYLTSIREYFARVKMFWDLLTY